ncbi:tetratricopeptide repeat protein [Gluconobacter oxydans]|nr:tetratricopeptide repeat protein [Gluconobacter oxydans]
MVQDDMKHALELAPDQPEVLNFVGYANIEHDADQAQALAMLKKAVDLQPTDASIQDSYAWALLKYRADIKTALPILVQAAEHAPSDAEIGYHLGVAYWYLGRHTEAQDQWNQSLDDNPQPQDRALLMQALQNGGPHLAAFEQKQ